MISDVGFRLLDYIIVLGTQRLPNAAVERSASHRSVGNSIYWLPAYVTDIPNLTSQTGCRKHVSWAEIALFEAGEC